MHKALRSCVTPLIFAALGLTCGQAQARGCSGTAYWDWHFEGAALRLAPYVSFVGPRWNDQISSIKIHSAVWRFYRDANFQGPMLELGPGGYTFQAGDAWNDQISSFQCVRPTN